MSALPTVLNFLYAHISVYALLYSIWQISGQMVLQTATKCAESGKFWVYCDLISAVSWLVPFLVILTLAYPFLYWTITLFFTKQKGVSSPGYFIAMSKAHGSLTLRVINGLLFVIFVILIFVGVGIARKYTSEKSSRKIPSSFWQSWAQSVFLALFALQSTLLYSSPTDPRVDHAEFIETHLQDVQLKFGISTLWWVLANYDTIFLGLLSVGSLPAEAYPLLKAKFADHLPYCMTGLSEPEFHAIRAYCAARRVRSMELEAGVFVKGGEGGGEVEKAKKGTDGDMELGQVTPAGEEVAPLEVAEEQ